MRPPVAGERHREDIFDQLAALVIGELLADDAALRAMRRDGLREARSITVARSKMGPSLPRLGVGDVADIGGVPSAV
jgi:hypothetical protein